MEVAKLHRRQLELETDTTAEGLLENNVRALMKTTFSVKRVLDRIIGEEANIFGPVKKKWYLAKYRKKKPTMFCEPEWINVSVVLF